MLGVIAKVCRTTGADRPTLVVPPGVDLAPAEQSDTQPSLQDASLRRRAA